jgi:hypothetical protein
MTDFFSRDLGNLTATAILGWFAWHIEGHNSAALGRRDHRWAVAVPVTLAYEGDPSPGDLIFPQSVALSPCAD